MNHVANGLQGSLGECREIEGQLELGSWLGKTHNFEVTTLWGQPADRQKSVAEFRRKISLGWREESFAQDCLK